MENKCDHKWGKVIVERDGKAFPSAARMCVKCGQLKVGEHTVSLTKNKLDMDDNPVNNVTDLDADRVYANEVHGTVYYQDIYFEDTECAICGEKFEEDDEVGFKVNTVNPEHISLVPVHRHCLKES